MESRPSPANRSNAELAEAAGQSKRSARSAVPAVKSSSVEPAVVAPREIPDPVDDWVPAAGGEAARPGEQDPAEPDDLREEYRREGGGAPGQRN